jgi:hypothetical protein
MVLAVALVVLTTVLVRRQRRGRGASAGTTQLTGAGDVEKNATFAIRGDGSSHHR